jgi:signal transduction histidine kinase
VPRRIATLLLVGAWLSLAGPAAGAADDGVVEYWRADLLMSEARTPPPAGAPWRGVALPDRWTDPARRTDGRVGWYRLRLPDAVPESLWAVYLWRYNMTVEVWFNGERLTPPTRDAEPVARDWNRPRLVTLPASGWRDAGNVVHVRLRGYPRYGALAPVFVGPREALAPLHATRAFLQHELSAGLLVLTLTVAVIGFAFWVPRREDSVYLWFALSALAWSGFSLNLVVREVPVPGETWWWLTHAAIEWWAIALALFAHRLTGLHRPRLERGLFAWGVLATVVMAAVDLPTFAVVSHAFHAGGIGIAVYLTVLLLGRWRTTGRTDLLVFGLGMLLIVVLAVHDVLMNVVAHEIMWRYGFFLLNLGAPPVLLALLWHLTRRYVEALGAAEASNRTLEARIAEARAALDASYAERRELELAQAATGERERIYRDLHDDVGARLLSLVYAARDEGQRTLARETLRELREIVSNAEVAPTGLRALATTLVDEARERAAAAGFDCEAEIDLGADRRLSAVAVWHVSRIAREAVSNALRHSGGRRLRLRVAESAGTLEVAVEDDGAGLPEALAGGRGLGNMRKRAAELGGRLDLDAATAGGCRMRLRVALDDAVVAPAAGGWELGN